MSTSSRPVALLLTAVYITSFTIPPSYLPRSLVTGRIYTTVMAGARYADIAVNLTDPMYRGEYHGKSRHTSDLDDVVRRARESGVERILITGTSLSESRAALDLAKQYSLHCTAGCHPTSTSEIEQYPDGVDAYMRELSNLIAEDRGEGGSKRIISIGEIGLDYDRLHYAPKEVQMKHFPPLLALSQKFRLPLFLHLRTSEAHVDFVKVLKDAGWDSSWPGGAVHSFTGTIAEAKELVDMGLYIGINGCSLKTEENLEMVKTVPMHRILLETDGPWCTPTSSHASSAFLPEKDSPLYLAKVSKPQQWKEGMAVKGRMEPAEIRVIAHVVARVKGIPLEELASAVWDNTTRLFYPDEAE